MDYISLGRLALWHHRTEKNPAGRVILVHGICEHSGRHKNTIAALVASGYEVVRFDLRGSGLSGGRPQYVDSFSDYTDDLHSVFNWTQTQLERLPTFLMGHSMGGAIVIHGSRPIQQLLTGIILSAPAYLTGSAISPLKVFIGRAVNRIYPTLRFPGGSDHGCISRIPEVVEEYHRDPLSFHFNTVRQGDEVLKALSRVPLVVPEIKIPVLLVHGTHDRLVRAEGSFEILQRLGASDRTLVLIPGAYHELHNDLCQAEFFQALSFWLANHSAFSSAEAGPSKRREVDRSATRQVPRPR